MTKLKTLIEELGAKAVNAPSGWEDIGIGTIFASDLISDILIVDGENILLVTSLLSEQVLRTAEVIGAAAVVLVNRKHIPASLGKAAAKHGLPMFYTPLPKFESCVCMGRVTESV